MKYLIVGSVILNDMLYADGSTAHGYLGGTIYSVNGVKPWEDDLLFITKTGPDYMKEIGSYLTDNNLSTDGIFPTLRKTIYSRVEYKPSGEWFEYSIYDDYSFEDWAKESRFKPEEVLQFCTSDTRGMYMEMGGDYEGFLKELHRRSPNCKAMWEIPTSHCNDPQYHEATMARIKVSDIYSLNLPESKNLFGTASEEESVAKIIELGVPCFFRVGTGGSYMIQDGKAWYAPLVDFGKSVDATGCGNCSTAAAMYGYAEGMHPLMTAIKANIASGINAAQFGPYLHFTPELRARINEIADQLFQQLIGDDGKKVQSKPQVFESLYK